MIKKIHSYHSLRRINILSNYLSHWIPPNSKILDVGCGDGIIDEKILVQRPDVKIIGIDVFKRNEAKTTVVVFDGKKLPFANNSFDCVLLIDTLHHAKNISELIKESVRVCKNTIIIKDHYVFGVFSFYVLKLMDWLGNKPYGVVLPYNYYSYKQWQQLYKRSGLKKEDEINKLNIFSFPFSILFSSNYHFIVRLKCIKR